MIYEQKEIYLKNLRQCMKRKNKAFLIRFRKDEKVDILDIFLKYVHNFVIVDNSEVKEHPGISMIRTQCNKDNIEVVLNQISNEQYEMLDVVSEDENVEDYQYLLFLKEKGQDLISTVKDDINDILWEEHKFTLIMYFIENYKIHTTYYFNRYLVIEMTLHGETSDEPVKVYENKELLPPCYILTTLGGLGDNFILFSTFEEFIQRKEAEGYKVYVAITYINFVNKYHDTFFYQKQEFLFHNNGAMFKLSKQRGAYNLIDFNPCFSENINPAHITSLVKSVFDIEPTFNPYTYNSMLKQMLHEDLTTEEIQYIDELTNNKKLIGLQYFTGKFDEESDIVVADKRRNWPIEQVERFVELCNQNGIEILALNPNPYSVQLETTQLKKVSVQVYAIIVSKLQLMVGIDSSGGHIASFFNVPSITIWGHQSPVDAFGFNISFRALRNNYSIWSKNREISSITAELVFEKVQEFLNGTLELSDDLITYEDSINQKYICVLEE